MFEKTLCCLTVKIKYCETSLGGPVAKIIGRTVRTCQPHLGVAADVCEVLGIQDARNVTRRFPKHEAGMYRIHTLGSPQKVIVVSEARVESF